MGGPRDIAHQTDDQLELYVLGRLDEPRQAALEEHLLVCITCQERLDTVEVFALAMRRAIETEQVLQHEKAWSLAWLRRALKPGSWRMPAALAGFAALIVAVVLSLPSSRNLAPLASLELTAIRGEVPSVEPARETNITLSDAPAEAGLRVEVVDATGTTIATSLKITKSLAPGSYFVRLYDRGGKLMHEYGFRVL